MKPYVATGLLVFLGVVFLSAIDSTSAVSARKSLKAMMFDFNAKSRKSIGEFEKSLKDLEVKRKTQLDALETKMRAMFQNMAKQMSAEKKRSRTALKSSCTAPWKFARLDLCLMYPTVQLNWTNAQKFCEQNGASLVIFENKLDFNAAMRFLPKDRTVCPWIGVKQKRGAKTFVRNDGGNGGKFLKWMSGQPDYKNHQKTAVTQDYCVASCPGGMVDQPCLYEGSFICQKRGVKAVV